MDLTESIAPKSDQLDAIELVSGPRTFKIERVSTHNAEQPFNFHLEGFPRVWRPGKSMRRIIVAAWGARAEAYVGQSVTLYCDPSIQFGNDLVGGTRISHMTGIDKPLKVPLLIKRGKSAVFTVQPLTAPAPTAPLTSTLTPEDAAAWLELINAATTTEELQSVWQNAITAKVAKDAGLIAAKDARKVVVS